MKFSWWPARKLRQTTLIKRESLFNLNSFAADPTPSHPIDFSPSLNKMDQVSPLNATDVKISILGPKSSIFSECFSFEPRWPCLRPKIDLSWTFIGHGLGCLNWLDALHWHDALHWLASCSHSPRAVIVDVRVLICGGGARGSGRERERWCPVQWNKLSNAQVFCHYALN